MVNTETVGWDESILKKDVNEPDSEVDEKTAAKCRNCDTKVTGKLKCSICKKAVYCHRECQKDDWQYHKRICKKPEAPKKKKTEEKTAPKPKPITKTPEVVRVTDDEDLKGGAKGYNDQGLPYFHRTLDEKEKQLIGDIAPKKIVPTKTEKVTTEPKKHEGSAWNASGTFEERDFSKWAATKIECLMELVSVSDPEGKATIKVTKANNVKGVASVCVVRGTKRYLFDFSFELVWSVEFSDGMKHTGKLKCHDMSNDDDHEMECQNTSKPSSQVLNQLKPLVHTSNSVLQKEVLRQIEAFKEEFRKL